MASLNAWGHKTLDQVILLLVYHLDCHFPKGEQLQSNNPSGTVPQNRGTVPGPFPMEKLYRPNGTPLVQS